MSGSSDIRSINRRQMMKCSAAAAGAWVAAGGVAAEESTDSGKIVRPDYRGPNVIIVRFGGGVRRLESIDPDKTYAPFLRHELAKRGTLYTKMNVDTPNGVETGHGQGTLNILTGIYDDYKDVGNRIFGQRFEAKAPTVFEYFRKHFSVPTHQTLIINGEDRTDEEFYSFSNHHLFGVGYRCETLSLYRYKCYLLRKQIEAAAADGSLTENQLIKKRGELAKLEALDYRDKNGRGQGEAVEGFWADWRKNYGDSGFKNPRGDRLLTELASQAIAKLRPRLMMINYNDPDYVHWGNMAHYTVGISTIDQGLKRLMAVCAADEQYRDNTVFVIVPDCGRDSNRLMKVPCQHHFNTRSSREIFALLMGPGIAKNTIVDKPVEQIAVAPTIGQLMGVGAKFADGDILKEAIA